MHPILVCLSVVLLSERLECHIINNVYDMSDECIKGRNITEYLTTNIGTSDIFVIMIASERAHCTFNFVVNDNSYVMLVVEFLDWISGTPPCGDKNNKVIVMVRNEKTINLCTVLEGDNIYRKVGDKKGSVTIESLNDLRTVKITATSLSVANNGLCESENVPCIYEDELFCMAAETKCDGHVNCGIRNKYDENESICKGKHGVNFSMAVIGIVTIFVSFCMMVALVRKVLPEREGVFIVKEDETLSGKDRATSQSSYQVDVRVLYDQPGTTGTEIFAEDAGPHRRGLTYKWNKRKDS